MTPIDKKLLIVDDERQILNTLKRILERRGYIVSTAEDGLEAMSILSSGSFDALLADIKMPKMDGRQLLEIVRRDFPNTSVIVFTGYGTIQDAVHAMKMGAYDYLTKPINLEDLIMTLEKLFEVERLRSRVNFLEEQIKKQTRFGKLVGATPVMKEIFQIIAKVGAKPTNVLIQGESGTGKELVARAIHENSEAASGPFMPVSCGAIPKSLVESQLFGHKRGAFTGATDDYEGLFRAAEGGTLFLDEIGEISTDVQVKLLRAIEEKAITPLGSSEQIKMNCRLIAATNRNLKYEIEEDAFRSDLYYRLSVVEISLPPLRERRDDIPLLANYFVEEFSHQYRVAPREIHPDAMEILVKYDFPGNVRELQNIIERAFALGEGQTIMPSDLPPHILANDLFSAATQDAQLADITLNLEENERFLIQKAIQQTGGNKAQAARLLGIDRRRLIRKLEKYK